MNEVVSLVAARRGIREDELMAQFTFDQILLKRHFDVREDKRLIEAQAHLSAVNTAEILAKAFGG